MEDKNQTPGADQEHVPETGKPGEDNSPELTDAVLQAIENLNRATGRVTVEETPEGNTLYRIDQSKPGALDTLDAAEPAQSSGEEDAIQIEFPIDTDPELIPGSAEFDIDAYREALSGMNLHFDSIRKSMETVSLMAKSLVQAPETVKMISSAIKAYQEQVTETYSRLQPAISQIIQNREFWESAISRMMDSFAELTPEELEALQEEVPEEETNPDQIIIEDFKEPGTEEGKPKRRRETKLDAIVTEALEESLRGYMRQGTATNTLTKIKPTAHNTSIDPITHTATITRGSMTVTIPNFDTLTGLKTSTYQLLDAFTTILTETGAKDPIVSIPLSEYMRIRGLKDRKDARKQVTEDLATLYNTSISFKDTIAGKEKAFFDMRICDFKGIDRRGNITFSFGSAFYTLLKSYPVMPTQPQLWKLNSKRNPNSYFLLRKLMEHKNMNIGKKNENIIAVKTLLSVCGSIPSYEEVKTKLKRDFTNRIINPFERDLNALEDTLTWEYCHKNGKPLTDQELSEFNYSVFIDALILTHWKNYPDQTARLKAKEARNASKGDKSKTKKKKNPEKTEPIKKEPGEEKAPDKD